MVFSSMPISGMIEGQPGKRNCRVESISDLSSVAADTNLLTWRQHH